jgi:hypothetical protein
LPPGGAIELAPDPANQGGVGGGRGHLRGQVQEEAPAGDEDPFGAPSHTVTLDSPLSLADGTASTPIDQSPPMPPPRAPARSHAILSLRAREPSLLALVAPRDRAVEALEIVLDAGFLRLPRTSRPPRL